MALEGLSARLIFGKMSLHWDQGSEFCINPALSIIIVVGNCRRRASLCLQSLLSQRGVERAEIILIDTGDRGSASLVETNRNLIRMNPSLEYDSYGALRAQAAKQAHGKLIAFIEEHCFALPGWVEAVLSHLDGEWAAISGEMHSANPGIGISDAVFLMNYTSWRAPAERQEHDLLPGHNIIYRRQVLLEFGDRLGDLLQAEAMLHQELRRRGHILGLDPAIKFAHANETALPSIARGYYLLHRGYGAVRARHEHWTFTHRLLRALATPLVPFVRVARMWHALRIKWPGDLPTLRRHFAIILATQTLAAIGLAAGSLFGMGDAGRRFVRHETDEPRPLPPGFGSDSLTAIR